MPDDSKSLDPRYFPLILDVLDQGVFTVDANLCISSFNQVAERVPGSSAEEVIGTRCAEVFNTNICGEICPLRLSIASRRPTRNREIHIRARDGRAVPISVSTTPGHPTVLVAGPSGTGKELIARTVHALSPRRKSQFVALNCAAIPETLLESELFGYKRGAFTDARKDKPGRIAAAEGGTLFLDEIGDLPRLTQVKLLRFLQDRIYEPLGSNSSVRANVHVVAATNRDLLELVRVGTYREDLYFRLNVVQIEVPPLCQRAEDIPLLVSHYVRLFRESTSKPIQGFSDEAMARLMAYSFPGNVRELENVVERAFILCQSDRIGVEHLPRSVAQAVEAQPVEAQPLAQAAGIVPAGTRTA